MAFPVAAAVSAGANIVGGLFGLSGASSANKANRDIAREQMAFQRQMSNSSYQRAVRDLKLAGLNPALAYSQGGATTPGGASTKMENTMAPLAEGVQSAGAVALQAQLQKAQIANLNAQSQKTLVEANQVSLESKLRVGDLSKRVALTDARGARELLTYHFENETYRDRVRNLGFLSDISGTESGMRLMMRDFLHETMATRIEMLKAQLRLTSVQAKQVNSALGGLENIEELQNTTLGRVLSWITAIRHSLVGGGK